MIPVESLEQSDYEKYRGKCKEMSEQLVANNPNLRLVRGHYYCPTWGEQAHWWCVDGDGQIHDPTARQFPSKGNGVYIEFNGIVTCEYCGEQVQEAVAYINGHHTYCSGKCMYYDVM